MVSVSVCKSAVWECVLIRIQLRHHAKSQQCRSFDFTRRLLYARFDWFSIFFFFWLGQATRSEDVVGIDCGGQRRVLLEMSSF